MQQSGADVTKPHSGLRFEIQGPRGRFTVTRLPIHRTQSLYRYARLAPDMHTPPTEGNKTDKASDHKSENKYIVVWAHTTKTNDKRGEGKGARGALRQGTRTERRGGGILSSMPERLCQGGRTRAHFLGPARARAQTHAEADRHGMAGRRQESPARGRERAGELADWEKKPPVAARKARPPISSFVPSGTKGNGKARVRGQRGRGSRGNARLRKNLAARKA